MAQKLTEIQKKFKVKCDKILKTIGGNDFMWKEMLESNYYAEGLEYEPNDECKAIYIAIMGYEHYKLRKNVSLARVRLCLSFVSGFQYNTAIWI